jgi:CRISPR-associated endonuclease/helicase Cas3
MCFWAHSDRQGRSREETGNDWQLLAEHLDQVSRLARKLACDTAPEDGVLQQMAASAGMLHDLGKYTDCFQKMLDGVGRGCPHSIYGALASYEDAAGSPKKSAYPVVATIAAHHAGLKDRAGLLQELLDPEEHARARAQLEELLPKAIADQPAIVEALQPASIGKRPANKGDLFIRMLLSCLVDADRLDTAHREWAPASLDATVRLAQLAQYVRELEARAAGRAYCNSAVAQARSEVQEACRSAALGDPRLLSLSVPTGGGKTLASMRFALERAAARPDEYRRIIVVIPYLSIIEQNAEVYSRVFGKDAVLEHHSGAAYKLAAVNARGEKIPYFLPQDEQERDDANLAVRRQETENWDAPIIVTTSVRFFESLFSNHPSDLRRVHNIARSIIVLDEVQTLPRKLLAPLLGNFRELTEDWGCTVLMATATQPAFEARTAKQESYAWPASTVHETISDPRALHRALQRVQIEWRLKEPTQWADLAQEMLTHRQALCVVNTRQHAGLLYAALQQAVTGPEQREAIFHLSTRMCAQHRLDVLAKIRRRLDADLPCILVSTQLIECGVDVDFPIAYRTLGPLDAIIQVAGRVDREGKLTHAMGSPAGRLIVFQSEDGKTPPHDYLEATRVTESLARDANERTGHSDMSASPP